jgi:hypothetical protein
VQLPSEREVVAIVETDGWANVPNPGQQPIYVSIVTRDSWLDRLRAVVWKPPIRQLEVTFSGSPEPQPFRLVPEIAAAGFHLNPDLRSLADLEAWVDGSWPESPMAVRIRVTDEGGKPLRGHFEFSTSPFPYP